MHSLLFQNTKNECRKLMSKRSTNVFMVLSVLFPLLTGPSIQTLQSRFGFTAFDGESFSLVILGLAVAVYLPLLLILAVSDMFSGEQEQNMLSFTLVRPISRFKVYSSKTICIGLYLLALLLIICVSSLLTGAFWLSNFTFHGILLGLVAFLVSWVPLMAIGILFIFLAQWIGSSSKAVIFSILIYLILAALTFLSPALARWFPSYDTGWYQRWINMGMGRVLLGRTLYLLSWSALFFTLGYYKFNKKEF
jgi:ABC-2 type transport system permease protein